MGIGIVLLWFLADAQTVRREALEALKLCAVSVIPALFPFLAVSGLLISLGFGTWAAPLFSGFMTPLYRLPGQAGSALLLGFAGGYPAGARTAADLYRKHLLTRDETERLLGFCNNANPAFFISVLGAGVFHSTRIGVWLWGIHIASALLTGLLFRGGTGTQRRDIPAESTTKETPFFPALVESVGNAALAMLRICAFVVFFYVLVTPFRHMGGHAGAILTGLVELFSLTPLLSADKWSFCLSAALSGWGGAGVLCQSAAALEGTGLSPRNCVTGKAVQGLLSGALASAAAVWLF